MISKKLDPLIKYGIDITNYRLSDLVQICDLSKPFYDWVSERAQKSLSTSVTLDQILKIASEKEIAEIILACYHTTETNVPVLYNGNWQAYPHQKACYYFFSWLIRDMPAQRLRPLISRIAKVSGKTRIETEIEILAALIYYHRMDAQNFTWDAFREVMLDRLEGSRRSIKGIEKETVTRVALTQALENYFKEYGNYGIYSTVELGNRAVKIGGESFDIHLMFSGTNSQPARHLLMSIKTRETEGGGHSFLFSRDVQSAINVILPGNYIGIVIIAHNWSAEKLIALSEQTDFLAIFKTAPASFTEFGEIEQKRLDRFISNVLNGTVLPKSEVK